MDPKLNCLQLLKHVVTCPTAESIGLSSSPGDGEVMGITPGTKDLETWENSQIHTNWFTWIYLDLCIVIVIVELPGFKVVIVENASRI